MITKMATRSPTRAARHGERAARRGRRGLPRARSPAPRPDAWIDTSRRGPKDGEVGLVGYEINFDRYFYRYTARPLEEIEGEIRGIEQEILRMLAEVTGSTPLDCGKALTVTHKCVHFATCLPGMMRRAWCCASLADVAPSRGARSLRRASIPKL